MSHLTDASRQWANRPADERFWTLKDAFDASFYHFQNSAETSLPSMAQLRIENQNGSPVLTGPSLAPALFTHFSFAQLCQRIGAPANYVRSLPIDLVTANLNHSLDNCEYSDVNLLTQTNGALTVKALTSDSYGRIWNYQLFHLLMGLSDQQGWKVPPARRPSIQGIETRIATEADCIATGHASLGIRPGDEISPAGIYASDRDMFCFLVDDRKEIQVGHQAPLAKGFFIEQSEVGDRALKLTTFLYDAICGNHIVWNVAEVQRIKLVHKGSINSRYQREIVHGCYDYAQASVMGIEDQIRSARGKKLGNTRDEVIEVLATKKLLPQKTLELCYDAAIRDEAYFHPGNDPRSAWGFAQGMTLYSQELAYASERVAIDRAAQKVISMAL